MADGLRALRWRGALVAVGFSLVSAWIWMSGGTTHLIQIDYSWAREMLDSAEVRIDGEVVGILQRYGRSNFVTGFEVEPGDHRVRVSVEGCEGVPETARLGGEHGRRVTFMADVDDGFNCRVLLR